MIRPMQNTPHDIQQVMAVWLESTVNAHPFLPRDYWEKNYTLIKDVYIPQSDTFVFVENECILGFISIIDTTFIGALFVDVNAQGRGIGKHLLEYASAKYSPLSLAVYKDNERAVQFYLNCGFTIQKTQANDDSGKTEYIMTDHKRTL